MSTVFLIDHDKFSCSMSIQFYKAGIIGWLSLACNYSYAQDSTKSSQLLSVPDKLFAVLDKKASSIEEKLGTQTDKYLIKLQKQEYHLKRKLFKRDSALARQVFDGVEEKYTQLKNFSDNTMHKYFVYSGHLDSLSTALQFLDKSLSGNPALKKALDQYKQLQSKISATEQIRRYLAERQRLLKEQFQRMGMMKQLKKFRKLIYYYQAQVKEYKQLFETPSKIEGKLMELVMKLPRFKSFFVKNLMLGSLFALPSGGNNASSASLAGLQTRAMISQNLVDRFGSGATITQQLQQNVQSAQGQINQLKHKGESLSQGSYGNVNDEDIPGFKPNTQKTKSFLNRLQYGADVQSQRARYFFPVTSDIALSLGYKINDKSSIGIGASYKLGWGSNWSNIRITHQGIGLRSYLDWKIKGSLYVSGGYEQNYRSMINSIDQLRKYSAWQTSALIGLSKKYSISKKMKGEMKLLWDFMSYQQVPKGQPVLFRIGYSLK